MPAMNFPSSPTNGQAYGQYVYDSTKGAWRVLADLIASAVPSPTAPTSPVSGDLWFNSNDGVLFMFFNDGNTSQWVEMKSNTASGSTVAARVDAIEAKPAGLVPVIPSSVTVGSGTATVSATGLITFSGVSSLSFNSVFTADFNSYRIVFYNVQCATGNAEIRLNLRAGTTNATTEYYGAGYVAFLGNTLGFSQMRSGGYIPGATVDAGDYGTSIFELLKPHLAVRTGINSRGAGYYSSNPLGMQMDGFHNYPNAYNGVYFYPGSGVLSGTAQIYGYR